MKYYLDTTIKSLFENNVISVRTYNCLSYQKFRTINDILKNTEDLSDLMKIRNFGRKSYSEILPVLREVEQDPFSIADNCDNFSPKDKQLFNCLDLAYHKVFNDDSSLSEYLRDMYSSGKELNAAILKKGSLIFQIDPNLNKDENIAMRRLYLSFIREFISNLETESLLDNYSYPYYKALETELVLKVTDFTLYEGAHYFMSPELHDYIEARYQVMSEKELSVRGRNFLRKYLPSFEDIIIYFDLPLRKYSKICPGQHRKKTLTEIFRFNQSFKKVYFELSGMSPADMTALTLKDKYPFLLSTQRLFVLKFYKENGYFPHFYLLYEYLRISEERADKIFSLYYGLFDNHKRTLEEVASVFDLSRERTRQIVTGRIPAIKEILLSENDKGVYASLFSLPYLCEDSEEFITLRNKENLSISFEIYAALLTLVTDYNLIKINGHVIAVNKGGPLVNVNFKDCFNTIEMLMRSKYSQETHIPIKTVMVGNDFDNQDLKNLMTFVIKRVYNLEISENDLIFYQNFIDISDELEQVLKENGKPMSVSEIFKKFKEKYPDHHFSDSSQIRAYLYKNEHIKAIGNQSLYGLDYWKNFFYGSIRDLVYEIVDDSSEPVHIGEIFEKVVEYFPDTNIKSVASSLQSDATGRFIGFKDGYYGIAGRQYDESFLEKKTVQRLSFDERLKNFNDFVTTYHRFPLSNSGEEESSLRRWYYNVVNGIVSAPSEELMTEFQSTIDKFNKLGYPRNGYECEFLANCEKYMEFIKRNYELPTTNHGAELYWWLKRSIENYNSYTDFRRQYLTSLISYIRSLGFELQ